MLTASNGIVTNSAPLTGGMVPLTMRDYFSRDEPIYVNRHTVTFIVACGDGTKINLLGDRSLIVSESIDAVAEALS